MGLFNFKSGKNKESLKSNAEIKKEIEQDLYAKNKSYRETKDWLDYQNSLLDRVNAAQKQFKEDNDLDAVIMELEYAFVTADPPCKTSQNMDLVKYYLQAGLNDKAWGYLNKLYMTGQAPKDKIRAEQGKLLKKENKAADAIEMFMLSYLLKAEHNRKFQQDKFIKDIKPCAKNLGWDETALEQLSRLIESRVNKGIFNENELIKEYREFYKSLSVS